MIEETILQVKNLRVNFHTYAGETKAIRDVSFDLEEDETLAIAGESGSGRSVTTRTLMGLSASNAEVTRDIDSKGRELTELKEGEWIKVRGNEIAMIFQDPVTSLNPIMRIGQQIAEPIMIHEKVSEQEALKHALELTKNVGILNAEEHINDYPHRWSGGMRQRAVIAITLAANPDILIVDESATALDVTIQAQVLNLMKQIQKERGSSIVFIIHDLGVVTGVADHAAVMYAGKIIEYGTVDEVSYNPQHPYAWGLLNSMPTTDTEAGSLQSILGTPPGLLNPLKGNAFAPRNEFALDIDYEEEPPVLKVSDTYFAATWLLDERASKVTPPLPIQGRWAKWRELEGRKA